MFKDYIEKSMKVYIDDTLVKSLQAEDWLYRLKETFATLRKYKMKLNPKKYTFGVASGKLIIS